MPGNEPDSNTPHGGQHQAAHHPFCEEW